MPESKRCDQCGEIVALRRTEPQCGQCAADVATDERIDWLRARLVQHVIRESWPAAERERRADAVQEPLTVDVVRQRDLAM